VNREQAQWQAFRFAQQNGLSGYYAEFGVWQGGSMRNAIKAHDRLVTFCKEYKKKSWFDLKGFVGYDSFEGLPEFNDNDAMGDYDIFAPGDFADTDYDTLYEALQPARLVKGFFEDSFKDEEIYPIAIAHIDCDIYSSTVEVLKFLESRLVDGAVLLFDDWFCYKGRSDKGERGAFENWVFNSFCCQEYIPLYAIQGKAFIYNTP
jgi:O-methyltransferase